MERLNPRQKEILTCLKELYPDSLTQVVLLTKLKGKPKDIDILPDIKLLDEKKLITVSYGLGSYFPENLTITPKGIEKLRENLKARLLETAYNNPWTVIAIIIPLALLMVTAYYYSENIKLQNENLRLQNQIMEENKFKQAMQPTVWLTQEFMNGSSGNLEIIPTLYFKKNSERLFTIANYEINITLNGKREPITGAGYKTTFKNEGINEGKTVFPSFYPALISYYDFFNVKNDLIIDYSLEIKDMDTQDRYRGNITTEIDSSVSPPKYFPSGRDPLIFNLAKIIQSN